MVGKHEGAIDVSDFGDWNPDDSLDTEPPAPEQVAYRLHTLRVAVEELVGRPLPPFEELNIDEQNATFALGEFIVDWLANNDPDDSERLAHALHDFREANDSSLRRWRRLNSDEREIATDLMSLILAWLRRQGAIA